MAIMNYNGWFYNQHKYHKGSRNGITNFIDNKWVNINDRFRKLVDMESDLLIEQPYLVNANNVGFDKLIDLMGRSNYTFEDLNDAMKDTYRMSLQNAMSRNVVNTHAVMFHSNNMDKKNVTDEKFTHYRIIEAPFNQLHFGHRDEFIRQKLSEMHSVSSGYYVPISKFNSSEFTKILDFSIVCTINGYFCNDCLVAISDKGFKFKVGWPYASDVDFIVYKLDHATMISTKCDASKIMNNMTIPYDALGISNNSLNGLKCLINVYDSRFTRTSPSIPNFGMFNEEGLVIKNLQPLTSDTIQRQKTTSVSLDIYALKFFHEVPDLYPAVNYVDLLDNRVVYDERYEYIKTPAGNRVVASSTQNINYLETCTPPIAIDRNTTYSFDIIIDCLSLYDDLMKFKDLMTNTGQCLLYGNAEEFSNIYKPKLITMYQSLIIYLRNYQQGAIITSLIPSEKIEKFEKLIKNIKDLSSISDFSQAQMYVFDELYGNNYKSTVADITEPFRSDVLAPFIDMVNLSSNYFVDDNSTRFNRPISEECFIALRYHRDEGCWLFDYPEIKHFHGIGNSFYINTNLKGNEIFKFFVLYSDNESPSEKEIDHFDLKTVLDFDLFMNEVDKHIGCIRYWDAENRLLKMAKMLYDKYDDETCVQVLSKILKRKLSGDDLIKVYPSDINYEPSNVTSDNVDDYTENSERGPFSINFLFYTLSMLNNNEDKLQAYFYRYLTNQKFNNRYADVDVSSIVKGDRYPLNYSEFTISPTEPGDGSVLPNNVAAFYGSPLMINKQNFAPYRYVLNIYEPDIHYPRIIENSLDPEFYLIYDDITRYHGSKVTYHDDIYLGRLMTKYLCAIYDYVATLQTNYKESYNQTSTIESAITTINEQITTINKFLANATITEIDGVVNPNTIITLVTGSENEFIVRLNVIKDMIDDISTVMFTPKTNIISYINSTVLSTLKYVYKTTGFDNNATKRARMLYIHLKKINSPMNPYQFKKWLSEIDLHILENLDDMIAENVYYDLGDRIFKNMYDVLSAYIQRLETSGVIDSLAASIEDLTYNFQINHVNPIVDYCNDMINTVTFDLFTIDTIDFDTNTGYNDKPAYVTIDLEYTSYSDHVCPPIGIRIPSDSTLVFQPIIDVVNDRYQIKSLSNICEYVFFNGETISNITMKILDANGAVIAAQPVDINFIRTSSTADNVNTFYQVSNVNTEPIEFINSHESFEVVNNLVVNEKHADMNYELLVGNQFTPLDHEIEMVLDRSTWAERSIDKIILENQLINRMTMLEFGHRKCSDVFFKPAQVFHIDKNNDGSIDSVYGKFFEGQTIYLKTLGNVQVTFPVKITAVDHSVNKGFIEAKVDGWNSKWFKVEDPAEITRFLTMNIPCEVMDDNMRNFLDEFSDGEYLSYYNPGFDSSSVVYDENIDNAYKLPGDPIFVSSNADFVYTRLNWIFNDLVPNRFIDEEHKTHRFIYVANGFINNEHDVLKINMINHDFNNMTLPERYPVLRDEPNDHDVWDQEILVFKARKKEEELKILNINSHDRAQAEYGLEHATTIYEREYYLGLIDAYDRKIEKSQNLINRLNLYIRQLEKPTTWFNIRSYDAALVYIGNGKADNFSPHIVNNIRDLLYTDKVDVFLYDWEHKQWLDPSTYEMTTELVDAVKIDECDDYSTNRVMYTFTISPKVGFNYSSKLLVYFSYNKSDIFDDVTMNPPTCYVRFKPLLSLDNQLTDYDPYKEINIRKHFDGYEKYKVDSDDIHVKRIKRSGKYTYAPTFRVCDILIHDNIGDHDYTDIDQFLVPNSFGFDTTQRKLCTPQYSTTIHSEIDSFEPGREVKLICISNNENSSYDGNISSIMFNALTSYGEDDSQQLTIIGSTLPNYATGDFICTVFQDYKYKPSGGVITVTITNEQQSIFDEWVSVPLEYMTYREVPSEFKIVMKEPTDGDTIVTLKNQYVLNIDDEIGLNNDGLNNPFEYYYDQKHRVRFPISNVRINESDQRLVIDQTLNDDVQIIKAPYIGICRYSVNRIPEDGFIDLTGYLPTPLSRNRYEFWINGRCINNENDVIILSPTSIQLCNMKSLRNFEVIELVDDINTDNDLFRKGTLYIDVNGNSYSNYRLALLSNTRIHHQDIKYIFNANVHRSIHDHTKNIITKPNNKDYEKDILSYISFDDNIDNYEQLYNIPSINGVSLFHPKLSDIGITEISTDDVIREFDKVWKYEETTNPLFVTTHRLGSHTNDDNLKIHIRLITEPHWHGLEIDTTGMYLVYATGPVEKYFSFYISKTSDGVIDDIENTVKIIPFIMPGVYVLIDPKYQGMWLHSTHGKTKPIHIINTTPEE